MLGCVLAGLGQDIGTEEKLLIKYEKSRLELRDYTYYVSPDGTRAAYFLRNGSKYILVADGKNSPEYDFISVAFSPDSKHFAYGAINGSKHLLFHDEKPVSIDGEFRHFGFSPDGKFYYSVSNGGKETLVIGEKSFGPYRSVNPPIFSSDGKRFAFWASKGRDAVIVDNGEEGPGYYSAGECVMSPDGKTVAYIAGKSSDTRFVVVNGRAGKETNFIGFLAVSPDGSQVGYRHYFDKKSYLVVNDKQVESVGNISGSITFSPDNKHVAYQYADNLIALDGKKVLDCKYPGAPVFSPDSSTLAFHCNVDGKRVVAVKSALDDSAPKLSEPFQFITSVFFSLDGKCMAVWGEEKGKAVLALIQVGPSAAIVKKSPPCNKISSPRFSADSKRIGCAAEIDKEVWWKVMTVE